MRKTRRMIITSVFLFLGLSCLGGCSCFWAAPFPASARRYRWRQRRPVLVLNVQSAGRRYRRMAQSTYVRKDTEAAVT